MKKIESRARKRGDLRAIGAGLATHYVSLAVIITIVYIARPFIWAAVYGVPYSPSKGQVDPNTNEWLFIQLIGFLSWVAAGISVAHWSPAKSVLAPVALGGLAVLLLFIVPLPATDGPRIAIWVLSAPLGILTGVQLYRRNIENRRACSDVT